MSRGSALRWASVAATAASGLACLGPFLPDSVKGLDTSRGLPDAPIGLAFEDAPATLAALHESTTKYCTYSGPQLRIGDFEFPETTWACAHDDRLDELTLTGEGGVEGHATASVLAYWYGREDGANTWREPGVTVRLSIFKGKTYVTFTHPQTVDRINGPERRCPEADRRGRRKAR